MRVVVSAGGRDLDSAVSPNFGRCPYFIFVSTDTMQTEAVHNPAAETTGGSGVQAAQLVASRGAQAVLTGAVGPNAFSALQATGIPVFKTPGGTVRATVQAYLTGQLTRLTGPERGF
jgi:predicted Fe-Mo cluster-binding NifX family protein